MLYEYNSERDFVNLFRVENDCLFFSVEFGESVYFHTTLCEKKNGIHIRYVEKSVISK